ncbi:MAG: hypothetical protein JW715_07370 [Sedimentisphaerales bacterium]|nr:hypothetical protein [Sedimentisphaerales bacterium]
MISEDDYSKWRSEKKFRLRVIMFVTPGLMALALLLFRMLARETTYKMEFEISVMAITMLLFSMMGALMLYLQTGFRRSSTRDTTYRQYDNILSEIKKKLEKLDIRDKDFYSNIFHRFEAFEAKIQGVQNQSQILSDDNRTQLVETIKARLENESAEQVLAVIQERVEEQISNDFKTKSYNKKFTDSLDRLQKEVSALSRRGNLNLVLGIFTTVTGLIILGYYVFYAQPIDHDPWFFTMHFLPRLTLVVFIEIFAYFFLRLYKSSLSEIKYFQNEMTNLESKFIALSNVLESQNKDILNNVITELSHTERNHILDKGQTTVELERAKADKDILSDFVSKVLALIGKTSN